MAVIEVERQFKPNEEQKKKLLDGAKPLDEDGEEAKDGVAHTEEIHDIYYDFSDYRLSGKNVRLRKRNGEYELKVEIEKDKNRKVKVKMEYSNRREAEEIKAILGISSTESLNEVIGKYIENGELTPFAEFTTKRMKYKKDGLNISMDTTDYGNEITEIEKLLISEVEIDEYEAKIVKLAKDSGMRDQLEIKFPGKLKSYLEIKNPELYKRLYKKESREGGGTRLDTILQESKGMKMK